MRKVKSYCLIPLITLWLMLPSVSGAVVETNGTVFFGNPINVSGPADATQYASIIFNSGTTQTYPCSSTQATYDLARIDMVPMLPWTGETYRASASFYMNYLFVSGYPGFALVPFYTSIDFNADLPPTTNGVQRSIPPTTTVAWRGSMPNATRIRQTIRAAYGLYIYKGSGRPTGIGSIPQQLMYRYVCYDTNNTVQEINNFLISSVAIVGTVTGCTPDNKAVTINMNSVPISDIENAGATTLINTKKYNFTLKCDPNVTVRVSVVDLVDPSNLTNIANLTTDSTAKGVGYAVTSVSGRQLQFGPDGSSVGIPNQIKYTIGTTPATGTNLPMSLELGFSYVRKPSEPIKSGSAKALIGITYSYQ